MCRESPCKLSGHRNISTLLSASYLLFHALSIHTREITLSSCSVGRGAHHYTHHQPPFERRVLPGAGIERDREPGPLLKNIAQRTQGTTEAQFIASARFILKLTYSKYVFCTIGSPGLFVQIFFLFHCNRV